MYIELVQKSELSNSQSTHSSLMQCRNNATNRIGMYIVF